MRRVRLMILFLIHTLGLPILLICAVIEPNESAIEGVIDCYKLSFKRIISDC